MVEQMVLPLNESNNTIAGITHNSEDKPVGRKILELSDMNRKYFDNFRDSKYPEWETDAKRRMIWNQYKSSIGNFLDFIGKDAAIVRRSDFDNFISGIENDKTRANKTAHVKSFLTHILNNNVANCQTRVGRETLLLVLSL